MTALGELHGEAFVLRVRPGREAEYRRRHEAVWPDLVAALREAGVVRYDIYLDAASGRVFGHLLRERAPDSGRPEAEAVLRWRRHMADVLEMDGEVPRREPVARVFQMS